MQHAITPATQEANERDCHVDYAKYNNIQKSNFEDS